MLCCSSVKTRQKLLLPTLMATAAAEFECGRDLLCLVDRDLLIDLTTPEVLVACSKLWRDSRFTSV